MTRRTEQGEWSKDDIRQHAEDDLEAFIRLVAPKQVLGAVHVELLRWMTRRGRTKHQLVLLPRDHQKSRMIAYRVAWMITKMPEIRILYISATANLAEKQLKFIKDILTSPIYRRYWPDMVHPDEGKREKWTNSEISVDHPIRKEEGVRDPTVFTGGLTTGLTGMHCDIAVLDDAVVYENAYTTEGRDKVLSQYSLLASIEGADAEEWVVGTRYHPKDLYGELIAMEDEVYNEAGEVVATEPIYEVFQREVEDVGDGSGNFLWPRQQRKDGKWFGFDQKILGQKRNKYLDKAQFRAQYYNDPNDATNAPIDRGTFQYYKKEHLARNSGNWYYQGRKLNVFAAIDFAYSRSKKADYTALVVVGLDSAGNVLVLDIERIRTDSISEYYDLILRQYVKWQFRKIRAETNAGQAAIVKEIKYNYLIPNGLMLTVDEKHRTRQEGTKEERIAAILEHRYENGTMWHFEGGECQNLEEELVLQRPAHDDIKDALASAIEIGVPPVNQSYSPTIDVKNYHPKFGGMR